MAHQATGTTAPDSRVRWLRKIGGVAACTTAALLLVGIIGLLSSFAQPGSASGGISPFQANWLIEIFVQHADFPGIHADSYGPSIVDTAILLLVSIVCLGLSTAFSKARRVWSLIALALSVFAIILFLATQLAGRSTVMLAALMNSVVMLGDRTFSRATAYTGILSSLLLFAGDLTVGVRSDLITILFGLGYVLMTAWLLMIARSLFRLGGAQPLTEST